MSKLTDQLADSARQQIAAEARAKDGPIKRVHLDLDPLDRGDRDLSVVQRLNNGIPEHDLSSHAKIGESAPERQHEQLRRDIQDGIDSGNAGHVDADELKRRGREAAQLANRAGHPTAEQIAEAHAAQIPVQANTAPAAQEVSTPAAPPQNPPLADRQ